MSGGRQKQATPGSPGSSSIQSGRVVSPLPPTSRPRQAGRAADTITILARNAGRYKEVHVLVNHLLIIVIMMH